MSSTIECYRCGASLDELTLPFRRLEECPSCKIELHVCRMCIHYAPSKPKQCIEDDAEEVKNKTAANFCDYFKPAGGRHDASFQTADALAEAQLANLFDTSPGSSTDPGLEPEADDALRDAEKLFKSD